MCGPPLTEASLCISRLDSLHLFSKVLNVPEHWFPSIFLATNPFFRVSVALRFGKPREWFEACALSAQTSCHPSKTEYPKKQSAKSLLEASRPNVSPTAPQNEGTCHKIKCIQHKRCCTLRCSLSYSWAECCHFINDSR